MSEKPRTAPVHDARFFTQCAIGGVLSCGITHTAITPFDLVKCRKQANPTLYKSTISGIRECAKAGWNRNGAYRGWQPTFVGYSFQGMFKFGGYELFKDVYSNMLGEKIAKNYKNLVYVTASATAEFFADMFLCPWEAIKVRTQISPVEANYPTKLMAGMRGITSTEGFGGLFKGLSPLWLRQIPYTIVKFSLFENIVAGFYHYCFKNPRDSYSKGFQLMVTFMSGYLAGVFCALVSHPFDSCVSYMNKSSEKVSIMQAMGKLGWNGCWRGLGTRIFMIGTLTGLQWWIYDSWKNFCGFPSSGGH